MPLFTWPCQSITGIRVVNGHPRILVPHLTSLALYRRLKSTETQKWNVTAEKAFIQGTGEREILTKEGRVGGHDPVSSIQGEFGIGNVSTPFYIQTVGEIADARSPAVFSAPLVFSIKKAKQSEEVSQSRPIGHSLWLTITLFTADSSFIPTTVSHESHVRSTIRLPVDSKCFTEEQQLAKLIANASTPSTCTSTIPATGSSNSSARGFSSDPSHSYTPLFSQQQSENLDFLDERAPQLVIAKIYQESGAVKKAIPEMSGPGLVGLSSSSMQILPETRFDYAVRGMGEGGGESMAIIQHENIMVAPQNFENGFTHFIKRFYKFISYGRANGAVALFAGHNAFLRWKAVQDAGVPSSMKPMERASFGLRPTSRGSFDLALRLLLKCYTLRWATYCQGGCQFDCSGRACEVAGMRVAGIIFNLIIQWWRYGPISKQLREFMQSAAQVHYKIDMSAYVFSYYRIAAATVGATLNNLLLWLGPDLDCFYLLSFEIFPDCVLVFPALGNLGFTRLEFCLDNRVLWSSAIEK
ncbi:hypothetical protein GYMLUDRAFT_244543 [Collybiopsis luxurians FD-317 M1]|uniref:Glycosyltransferase 2-like domain-containing protein n=1 Tax=Collybiopsis luxurians FD-317 M1 TaxID=944289 RepID=A0A0D0CVQ5_9AGAR|nr:hypothetical protein GYMLUDRAFT_244543 [Collybiopsis luxurians FD-317 M1]